MAKKLKLDTRQKRFSVRDDITGILGDGNVDVSIRCLTCLYLDETFVACVAFPDGIPAIILNGEYDHKEPFDGDNDIQFEPLE